MWIRIEYAYIYNYQGAYMGCDQPLDLGPGLDNVNALLAIHVCIF